GALIRSFFAGDPSFTGGVYVAAGDVNGDHKADIITGAGSGGVPQVEVFSGTDGLPLQSFLAYGAGFAGGVRVAAGGISGGGHIALVTGAGPGAGPHVRAFSTPSLNDLFSFFAFDPLVNAGVFVAASQ